MSFELNQNGESFAAQAQSIRLGDGDLIVMLRVEAKSGRDPLVDLSQVVHQALRRTRDAWSQNGGNKQALVLLEKITSSPKRYDVFSLKPKDRIEFSMTREEMLDVFNHDDALTAKLKDLPASLYA